MTKANKFPGHDSRKLVTINILSFFHVCIFDGEVFFVWSM